MRRIGIMVVAGMMMAGAAWGEYGPALTGEDLVNRSDVIVLAKVTSFKVAEGAMEGSATLELVETLKGEEAKGPVLLPFMVVEDEWMPDKEPRMYVFFLKRTKEGLRQVNKEESVSREVGPKDLEKLREMIRKTTAAEVAKAKAVAERCDLIVVGTVSAVRDYTANDGGKGYDVKVESVVRGKHVEGTVSFVSRGWVGYADYRGGERVLVFLKKNTDGGDAFATAVMDGRQVLCKLKDDRVVEGPLGEKSFGEYMEAFGEVRAGKEAWAKWSEAVEGAQARLTADKETWGPSETPTFRVELRNAGQRKLEFWMHMNRSLELDGEWYLPVQTVVMRKTTPLGPGQEEKIAKMQVPRNYAKNPVPKTGENPGWVKVAPGRHTMRVAFMFRLAEEKDGKTFKVISNAVGFEVMAKEEE